MPREDSASRQQEQLYVHTDFTHTHTGLTDWKYKKQQGPTVWGALVRPAQDRYVMLALSRSRMFASFLLIIFRAQRRLRAKVDRLKVVTQNICVILFGYLSVFGPSVPFRPASRFRRASISFAAMPQT